MNDAQTLALIHAVAWPILILSLSKMWNYHDFPSEAQHDDESRPVVQKRSQLFICLHIEALTVVAMCVRDPECSPVGINR